jgi:signal transduction histidine kinase
MTAGFGARLARFSTSRSGAGRSASCGGSPTKTRALDAVERSARLQAQLTADLLDISGAASGKLRLDLDEVAVPPLVEGVLDSLRPVIEGRQLHLRSHVDAPTPLVLDPARVQQIISNLLSNAVKFTPPGGEIAVDVRTDGGELVIRVSDTGAGISPEFLPHVFERFRQEDAGTGRAHGGLGLGLSIVKHLAELHGGTASAESAGLQRGAAFTVRLPAIPRPAPRPAAPVPR